MFANTRTLVVLAACAVAAQAQSTGPSSTATAPASQSSLPAGIDNCILGCLTQATGQGGCSSYTDLACVCTSSAYQSAVLSCLEANCTAQDITVASQLASQECGASVSTGSGAMSSTVAPSGSAVTSSSASSPTTSKSAAMGLTVPFSLESVFGTILASAGALLGAAFVL